MQEPQMKLPEKKMTALYGEAPVTMSVQATTSAQTDPTVTCGTTITTTTHVVLM